MIEPDFPPCLHGGDRPLRSFRHLITWENARLVDSELRPSLERLDPGPQTGYLSIARLRGSISDHGRHLHVVTNHPGQATTFHVVIESNTSTSIAKALLTAIAKIAAFPRGVLPENFVRTHNARPGDVQGAYYVERAKGNSTIAAYQTQIRVAHGDFRNLTLYVGVVGTAVHSRLKEACTAYVRRVRGKERDMRTLGLYQDITELRRQWQSERCTLLDLLGEPSDR